MGIVNVGFSSVSSRIDVIGVSGGINCFLTGFKCLVNCVKLLVLFIGGQSRVALNCGFDFGRFIVKLCFLGVLLFIDGFPRLVDFADIGDGGVTSRIDVIRVGSGVDSLLTGVSSFINGITLLLLFSRR